MNTAERKRTSERRTRRVDEMWRKGAERWRRGRAIERGRKRGKGRGKRRGRDGSEAMKVLQCSLERLRKRQIL